MAFIKASVFSVKTNLNSSFFYKGMALLIKKGFVKVNISNLNYVTEVMDTKTIKDPYEAIVI